MCFQPAGQWLIVKLVRERPTRAGDVLCAGSPCANESRYNEACLNWVVWLRVFLTPVRKGVGSAGAAGGTESDGAGRDELRAQGAEV